MTNQPALLLLLSSLLFASACADKKKEEAKPTPTATEQVAEQPQVESAAQPLSEEAEKALTEAFILRFVEAIEADDASRWPEIITPERRAKFEQEGVIDEVYKAWRRGTATVASRIREAPFRLEKTPEKMTLHFENVIVANDPETGYSMTVKIIAGQMYLDEN